jgi:hypothetical protein
MARHLLARDVPGFGSPNTAATSTWSARRAGMGGRRRSAQVGVQRTGAIAEIEAPGTRDVRKNCGAARAPVIGAGAARRAIATDGARGVRAQRILDSATRRVPRST